VKGFVEAFQVPSQDVMSPTFTLVREYGSEKKIYHVDLYRLENEEQIFEAGIYELLASDDLVIVEWADRLKRYHPEQCIEIHFSHQDTDGRVIEVNR
jgi:tRNA threonylcarbamoyladenosine biosynthesis protein TsaE